MTKLEAAEGELKHAAKAYGKAVGDDAVAWRELARAALRYAAAWTEDSARKAGSGLRQAGDFIAGLRGRARRTE